MYVICTYDVKSKNCPKFMKLLRRYLFHVQESVFEGELTPSKYKKMKSELDKIISKEDNVMLYFSYNSKMIKRKELGKKVKNNIIIID